MEVSGKMLSVFLGILFLAAAAGANTTPPANCTPHPAIFDNGNGGPLAVSCPPFTVRGATLTGITLTFEADYQFGGSIGTNAVDVIFAPAGPEGVTWAGPSVKLTTGGVRSSGPAPTGSMNTASVISAAEYAAAFNVNVTSEVTVGTVASSSGAASVVYTYTPPPPITLTCPAGSGTTGVPYSSALVATGGVPPYTFSITSGSLPPGSALNATGDLKGTPTTVGTFNFTAQVVDSIGTPAGTTTAHCTITNTNRMIVTGWRKLPPPSPPTGECPNTAAPVASARIAVVNEAPRVVAREYPQDYRSPRQTPYLIAFTDSSVRLADVYWVSDDTLYYVTADHALEQVPLNSLDRTLSERLNCEKNLRFYLPAQSQ